MKTITLNQIFSLVFLGFSLIFSTSNGNATEFNTNYSVDEHTNLFQSSNFSLSQIDGNQSNNDNVGTMNVLLYTKEAYETGATSSDAFVINFTRDGNNGIDLRDAPKMMNFDENLARLEQGQMLVVENRAVPTPNESLQLFINQFSTSEYVLKFITPNFTGLTISLVDNFTKENLEVETGTTSAIYFSIDDSAASQAYNRFAIEFNEVTLGITDNLAQNNLIVYPNPVKSNYLTLQVPSNLNGDLKVEIFNTQSRKVFAQLFTNQSLKPIEISDLNLKKGVYIIKVTGSKNLILTQKIIKS